MLHVFLLPLNIVRLREMTQLIKQVEKAATGDLNMAWIKPFTSSRRMNAGEVLFRKGETANCLFCHRLWALPSHRNRHRPRAGRGRRRVCSDLARQNPHADAAMHGSRRAVGNYLWASQAALLPESDIWILLSSAHQWPTIREYQAARVGSRSVARAISCTISRIAGCTGVTR